MCPSRPPDPNAWRNQPWRSGSHPGGPGEPRRSKHPWITSVVVILGLLLGLGAFGALLEGGEKRTSGTASPTKTPTARPSDDARETSPTAPPATAKPPAEPADPSDGPAATPTTKPEPPSTGTAPPGVVVLRVIDGDTLEVRGDGGVLPKDTVARVRLLAMWTDCPEPPETSTPPPDSPDSPDSPAPDTPARPDLPDGPPASVPDVDCSDLSGPVRVGPHDPHRLDRDGDGIGCDVG
ncbi:hypothetical protein ACPCUK_16700 [Streptomyces arboris]|uniref:hypothetical protein n=1 Tax=Streptomyces arboris TaxID=2600619 RepID=UPI003C2FFFD1